MTVDETAKQLTIQTHGNTNVWCYCYTSSDNTNAWPGLGLSNLSFRLECAPKPHDTLTTAIVSCLFLTPATSFTSHHPKVIYFNCMPAAQLNCLHSTLTPHATRDWHKTWVSLSSPELTCKARNCTSHVWQTIWDTKQFHVHCP